MHMPLSDPLSHDDIEVLARHLRGSGLQVLEVRQGARRLRMVARGGAAAPAPASALDAAPVVGSGLVTAHAQGLGVLCWHHPAEPHARLAVGQTLQAGAAAAYLQLGELVRAVESPGTGTVVELLAADGERVDFGKPLFLLRVEPA
jgi:biotin carboxyl carrier protein